MSKPIWLTIFLAFALINIVFATNPEPEFLDVDEDLSAMVSSSSGRRLATLDYPNLRMTANFDYMEATDSYIAYFKNSLIPPILSYFQATLKVKYPVTTTIKLSTSYKTICGVTVPQALYTGVATDYYIFFNTFEPTTSGSGSVTVASSYACQLATGTKRPLIANTKINPDVLVDASTNILLHEKNMYLIMHEMTHTLGFAQSLYKYFLDDNGAFRTGHIKNGTLGNGTSLVLDVPPLTQRLRTFFGCPTLEGAYMENSGSAQTAGDHFERRHFMFEAMTSGLIYQQSFSQFTLALLEGSGWYVANYSMADPYFFGQGQGCDFLFNDCTATNFTYSDFCKGSSKACTVPGRGAGFCQSDIRSDNCRINFGKVDYDCENENYDDVARLPTLETFGRNSGGKCFEGTLSAKSTGTSAATFCFKPTCSGSGVNTTLTIKVGATNVTCKAEGTVKVTGYYGVINCPDPLTFCSTVAQQTCPRGCMGRGNCVKSVCVCNKGFTGKDCALNV